MDPTLLIGPLMGLVVALIVGFKIWEWQTRRKRRIEVAEQCLIAFDNAALVLALARNPLHRVYVGRIDTYTEHVGRQRDQTRGLAEAITLARIHLGDDAVNAMKAVVRAWGETLDKDPDPNEIFARVARSRSDLLVALKPYLSEKATAPPWD